MPEPIAVDLVDIRHVERAEHVLVELAERDRAEPVEHVYQHVLARPVPLVVVLGMEQRLVLAAPEKECPGEHLPDALVQPFVRGVEAAVVQHLVHEGDVLPRPIEEDPRHREVRDSE